jgi:hypothetical protein
MLPGQDGKKGLQRSKAARYFVYEATKGRKRRRLQTIAGELASLGHVSRSGQTYHAGSVCHMLPA